MKRFLFSVVFLLLFGLVDASAFAEEVSTYTGGNLAVLQIGSAAEGSTVNYFFLRDVMAYRDIDGVYTSRMFDGIVFTEMDDVNTPERTESFISRLENENVFGAVDTAMGIFVEDGLCPADIRYPLYVSFPNPNGYFSSLDSTEEFCVYYIDTLCSVFSADKYEYAYLAGLYFDASYDTYPALRDFCIDLVKTKGLTSVAVTKNETELKADRVFAEQFCEGRGVMVEFGEVPNADNATAVDNLTELAKVLSDESYGGDLLFVFDTFTSVYDCAAGLEEAVPNDNARRAYDDLKLLLDGKYADAFSDALSGTSSAVAGNNESSSAEQVGRTVTKVETYLCAALAVFAVVALFYIAYVLIKRVGTNEGQKER